MHLARKASKDCVSVFTNTQVLSRDIFTDVLTQLGVDMVPLKRTDYFVPIDTEAVSGDDRKLAIDWATADRFEAIFSTDGGCGSSTDERLTWPLVSGRDVVGLLCAHTWAQPMSLRPSIAFHLLRHLEISPQYYAHALVRSMSSLE